MTAAVLDRPTVTVVPLRLPRLIPAPECEPPLTDVRMPVQRVDSPLPAQRRTPQPTVVPPRRAHRRWAPAAPRPAAVPPRTPLPRPVHLRAEAVPLWSKAFDCGVRRTPTAELPDAVDWATVVCRGLLESLSGRRRVEQLRRYCAPDIFAGLERRVATAPESPALLISLDVCQPADGAAEAAAIFRCAGRTRAMAIRFQGLDGSWRVTDLQLG